MKFTFKSGLLVLLLLNFLFISAQGPNTRFVNPTGTTGTFSKSFVKHLNSNPDEMFYSTGTSGSTEYFGTNLISPMNESRMISRLDIAGLPVWTAQFYPESSDLNINSNGSFACTDNSDNFYIAATTSSTTSVFKDAAGIVTNFVNPSGSAQKILFKLDSNGNKVWTKVFDNPSNASLRVSLTTDSVGDLYVVGDIQGSGMVFEGTNVNGTFFLKFLEQLVT